MWLIPSLKYICFRKLRLTQPPLFRTARLGFVCLFNPIFVISCVLVVPRDSNAIRTVPHKALCQYTATITLPASMDFTIWLHSSDLLLLKLRTIFISSVRSYSGSRTIHTHPDQARHGTTHQENPRQSGGVGTFDTTLLIIALMVHIFIQAASYEQLTNPSEQHFISAQQLCFQTFLIPARDSN